MRCLRTSQRNSHPEKCGRRICGTGQDFQPFVVRDIPYRGVFATDQEAGIIGGKLHISWLIGTRKEMGDNRSGSLSTKRLPLRAV